MPATRHDGWTGEKMARFCETLADTAVVAEACDRAGMGVSGAYALRRRDPFFAAAWDAALTIARERLADTLLARSIEGNVEQIWRDGELVGERHVIDNRLGLAILRRLDRLAETGTTVSTRGERSPASIPPGRAADGRGSVRGAPAPRSAPFDWDLMVNALRTGDPDDVVEALALLERREVEEVEASPVSPARHQDKPRSGELSDRCWKDESGAWMTDFPPPPRFIGWSSGRWGERGYERTCTDEEAELLEATRGDAGGGGIAADQALRDSLFGSLQAEAGRSPDCPDPRGSAH